MCCPISASAFSTEFSALFSWVRPVLVSSPQCDGSDLRICFFSSSFPPCVGWGVAPSRCSCGLGGWWRGENRGSGSALAANSALDRVSSQEMGTPAADFAQDRLGSRRSVVRLRTLHVQFWDRPQSCSFGAQQLNGMMCSLWLFPFCFPQLPTRACSG